MQVPSFGRKIREWRQEEWAPYDRSTALLKARATGDPAVSRHFQDALEHFVQAVQHHQSVPASIRTPLDVRILGYCLHHRPQNAGADIRLCHQSLRAIEHIRPQLGRMDLRLYLDAYFAHLDECCTDAQAYQAFRQYLRSQIELLVQRRSGRTAEQLANLARNIHWILTEDAPENIANQALKRDLALEQVLAGIGLTNLPPGAFNGRCRGFYYCKLLERISPGSSDPVLEQILDQKLHELLLKPGDLLGHHMLRTLIDRSPEHWPEQRASSEKNPWIRWILRVARDPRSQGSNFERWWKPLGRARIDKVIAWLSGVDLEIFLEVLDWFAKDQNKHDLQRMYPARREFLKGLIRQNLVQRSRLFITPVMDRYLRRKYKGEELPEYAFVRSQGQSLVYLQLGDVHLIEGTHNAPMWIFDRLPENTRILDMAKTSYAYAELGQQIGSELGASSARVFRIRHAPNRWKIEACEALQRAGVNLDARALLDSHERQRFRSPY